MKQLISRILALVIVWSSVSVAGQIAPELRSVIDTCQSNKLIKVWIRLPQAGNPAQLKSSVVSQAQTRESRYELAQNRLKSVHSSSQKDLLTRLQELEKTNKCRNIKPSWLANVVEVEVSAGELQALSVRSDIETIYAIPKLELIEPDLTNPNDIENLTAATVDTNLKFIKAPQAWAAGYTGSGRVICSFDTGVDGDHPALLSKWKGLNADSAASWFDPLNSSPFPYPVLDGHGTGVMGIMVGSSGADTIGLAFNAKWISAAIVDINGASYIDAFEWAANPDGNPNTVDDVPDVINHSWGIAGIGCQEVFYDIIDNLEALGIVNIFACGNSGPGAMSIRNPANGADDSLDCFAVGNISTSGVTPPTIVTSSSRGPSDCTGGIKPNVCAPGQSIRTAAVGTGYTFGTGTSFAAPHVSALVALLRQKNPNATVDQIKLAILNSTQFRPSPVNNNFGWGVIDCMAALNALSSSNPTPNVRVYDYEHNSITPGGTVGGLVSLQNLGASVTELTGSIIGNNPSINILDGTCSFGAISSNTIMQATDSIRVSISDTVTAGTILSVDFRITNNTTYTDTLKLYFLVEPALGRTMATHNNGQINFTISNFGTYSFGPGAFVPIGGTGFNYAGGGNDFFECGLLFGYNATHISDGIRNSIGEPDGDFRVLPGGHMTINIPGAGTAQKSSAKYDDSRAENPAGFEVRQFMYTFSEPELDDLVIMRYLVKNTNGFPVTGVRIGLYMDWDIFIYNSNAGGYDASSEILWMAYNDGIALSRYRGSILLDGTITGGWTSTSSVAFYPEGFTETEKYNSLGVGFTTATTYATSKTDLLQVISAGPVNYSAGETKIFTFAFLAGNSLADLQNVAVAAANINDTLLNSCCVELRGDINNDGANLNVLDLTYIVDRIFRAGPAPVCFQEADVTGDQSFNVLDLTFVVDRIFRGGPPPLACPGY